jgi:formate dehydrogenase major subunit
LRPGEVKVDWWITQEIARRIGLAWNYQHPSEIYTEMASLMPALDNISWTDERKARPPILRRAGQARTRRGVRRRLSHPGPAGKLVPARITRRTNAPTRNIRSCSRPPKLEHWHTGAMTRRAPPRCAGAGAGRKRSRGTIARLGIAAEIWCGRPRAAAPSSLPLARMTACPMASSTFPLPLWKRRRTFTNPALDPFGKIPEFILRRQAGAARAGTGGCGAGFMRTWVERRRRAMNFGRLK